VTRAPGGSILASPLVQELGMTRTVRDTAHLLDAIHGPAPGDGFEIRPPARPFAQEVGAPAGRLRFGMTTGPWGPYPAEPAVIEAVEATGRLLEEMGHVVEQAKPDISYESYYQTFGDLWCASKPAVLDAAAAETGRKVDATTVEPNVLAMYEKGLTYSAADLIRMLERMNVISRQVAAFYETYDVMLTPTMSCPPVPLGYADLNHPELDLAAAFDRLFSIFSYTPLINMTGQPAISLPLAWADGDLPVGVHFVARFGAEDLLLRLAAALEEARPWRDRRPQVHVANV
jgi:amidase